MIPNYTPPPQPAPAEVQTVNAAQAQRLASPTQSVIKSINQGQYGKGFTASMPNSAQQPSAIQKTQNAMNASKNAGSVAKGIGDARNQRNINSERNSALNSQKNVPAQRPPNQGNKGIEAMNAKTANGQQTATARNSQQATPNKGIEASRQKSTTNVNQQNSKPSQAKSAANKGIANYQSKTSGQSSSAAKGSSKPAATASKGTSASASKSSGSSGAGKSGGGQSR